MILRILGSLIVVFAVEAKVGAQQMQKAEEPEEVGLVSLGEAELPVPEGLHWFSMGEEAVTWNRFEEKQGADAPEGSGYRWAEKGPAMLSLAVPVRGATPYLLSMWVRSREALTGRATFETTEVYYGKNTPLEVPATMGEWKRATLYFRTAPGSVEATLQLRCSAEAGAVSLDDVRFREATEKEFSDAYARWRSQYPERDLSPRPGFGRNLENFRRKLREPIIPDEPLLVMGIGSSYTNMLGTGERLIQWVRERYPDAPPIHYKKHVGSAVNYDFTRGWMRQHVLGQRPDLVILYSGGTPKDLDKLLSDFRAHSSADIIVASLHLRERDREISEEVVNDPLWDEIREVALKYHCEWVDSRREWAAYLTEHEKPIEWLLKDAVHQNDHGALVINENIVRHLVEPVDGEKGPAPPERLVTVRAEQGQQHDEETLVGRGALEMSEGVAGKDSRTIILKKDPESYAELTFRGNRIDLIGVARPHTGKVEFELDGIPLGEVPSFYTTLIKPGKDNHKPARGSAADRSPHMIRLGSPDTLRADEWTITMTSNQGDYRLSGLLTGPDGEGNNGEDFVSSSGQIIIPSALWRRRLEADGTHSNRKGDTFSWLVHPAVIPRFDFWMGDGELFSLTIADQLPFGRHVLKVRCTEGDEGVAIAGFVVHQPAVPGKENAE